MAFIAEREKVASSQYIDQLQEVMAALRDPETGCPWDKEQSFETIAPYTIEEAYEVADAIERNDLADLKDELGDLLFQVVYHARMAEEAGAFAFDDVVLAITDKMIRRHPHVFGDVADRGMAGIHRRWEEIKAEERAGKQAKRSGDAGLLDDVPTALPALSRAAKLQRRAANVGFDWPDAKPVITKLREELAELEAELMAGSDRGIAEELGDLLFTVANLARHVGKDPENALRAANTKFQRRFAHMETAFRKRGVELADADDAALDAAWEAAKAAEKSG